MGNALNISPRSQGVKRIQKVRRNPSIWDAYHDSPVNRRKRETRDLIALVGERSGTIHGFVTPADLDEPKRGDTRRAAQALANRHHEPIRFERVAVTTLAARVKENPAPRADKIGAAARRFSRFTGHRAERIEKVPFPSNPGAGLAVGPVLMLAYSAKRDGKTENYLHKFAPHARPSLVASHDGRHLYLLGGRYKFTERGIVDQRRNRA